MSPDLLLHMTFSFPSNSDILQLIPVMVQHQRGCFSRGSWAQSWQWLTPSCLVVTPITAEELSPKCQLCCLLKWNCAAGRGFTRRSCHVGSWWQVCLSAGSSPSVSLRPHRMKRSGEMSRPVFSNRCSHLPRRCLPLPGWGMRGIQLNVSASGFGHQVTCDRCPDLEWCQWLVWSPVILIASYQIKQLDAGRQSDGWSLAVSRSCEAAGASKSLKVALTFVILVLFST